MSGFDLIDLISGDRIAQYSTVHDALVDVWDVLHLGGENVLLDIRLEYNDGSGRNKVLAEGARLMKMAALAHPGQT